MARRCEDMGRLCRKRIRHILFVTGSRILQVMMKSRLVGSRQGCGQVDKLGTEATFTRNWSCSCLVHNTKPR